MIRWLSDERSRSIVGRLHAGPMPAGPGPERRLGAEAEAVAEAVEHAGAMGVVGRAKGVERGTPGTLADAVQALGAEGIGEGGELGADGAAPLGGGEAEAD